MEFDKRYAKLNARQKEAVDTIEGPVMVVAGPGTGKTELLGMRAANILQQTDVLAQNILCLTFTESGAAAMRERLTDIIGAEAYKVAIHTFHSFGSEIINHYGDYFYQGAHFRPADEVSVYQILRGILDELEYTNPLAGKMNGEYTHLGDITSAISELKRSGLTSDELLAILDDNDRILDTVERDFASVFAGRIGKSTASGLTPLAEKVASLSYATLPPGVTPLSNTLALSLSHAIDAAQDDESTKPITAWRNAWFEKNDVGAFIFKDRRRHIKLRALSYVYFQYLTRMQEQQLYDFDDMVLRTVHAMEVFDDLRFNLQEQYQYIMVDEFQDTNLAQARILKNLTQNSLVSSEPNIMVVGDDDQAIYSFQGAEISNILQFRDQFETVKIIPLTDNYRSAASILKHARTVITQGTERLETILPDLDKTLAPHATPKNVSVALHEHANIHSERAWIAHAIAEDIKKGVKPGDITVIARHHKELVSLLPYLEEQGVTVNYERQENILDNEVIEHLLLLVTIVHNLATQRFDDANSLLPRLLAHPAWNIPAKELWQLGLSASSSRLSWMEQMALTPVFNNFQAWLLEQAKAAPTTPLEPMLDQLLGRHIDYQPEGFISPLIDYFFSDDLRQSNPEHYITYLDALRTLREKMREFQPSKHLYLSDLLEFVSLHRQLGTSLKAIRLSAESAPDRINLMTAHKSKGSEYPHVYIHGAIDSAWGERVRTRSRLIGYPENLQITAAGDTPNERLRLFFVAMTRAKAKLSISYSLAGENGNDTTCANFLVNEVWRPIGDETTVSPLEQAQHAWYQPVIELKTTTMQELLASTLDRYKLSATHLGTFLDVTRGGPQHFLLNNLLRFPQAISPNAAYGSAIHRTLQQTHSHLIATSKQRPLEDILHDFETNLDHMKLSKNEFEQYLKRGSDALGIFFDTAYDSFIKNSKTELNFAGEQSRLNAAHLTGSLDAVIIDTAAKTMTVTDFKTGKACLDWRGASDHEKSKLHRYRQQLMFYKLLIEHSRTYSDYTVDKGILQFVEPTPGGIIVSLELEFNPNELIQFTKLIGIVWEHITRLDLPDTSSYSQDFKGIKAFEADLLDGKI
ncbi:MAG: ATP-dependent DNA helicase [Candidatus Saccharimonadales bacterium]